MYIYTHECVMRMHARVQQVRTVEECNQKVHPVIKNYTIAPNVKNISKSERRKVFRLFDFSKYFWTATPIDV